MEKYEILIDGKTTLKASGMGWEYPQTDGEGSGANDENVFYREVLPERDKITLTFGNDLTEEEIRTILAVRSMEQCLVNYYDLRAGDRLEKIMYPVSDSIVAKALINGEFLVEPFELRFVQMIPN